MTESLCVHWTFPDGRTVYVGDLRLRGSAQIQEFIYDSMWCERGFSIGEGLPLVPGPITPSGGATTFGVFDDAGPDSWGRFVIARTLSMDQWDTSTGLLASVADTPRQGALRFSTARDSEFLNRGELQDVRGLSGFYEDIQRFLSGENDRGLLRRIFAALIAQVARGAWDRAPCDLGLDEGVASACGAFIEAACDFDTVLDGSEPRFAL